jgi:hypothetical protein
MHGLVPQPVMPLSRQHARRSAAPAGHATHLQPRGLAVNPPTHTAHVNNIFQVGSLSVFKTARY